MSNDNIKEIGRLSKLFSSVADRPAQVQKVETEKAAETRTSEAVKVAADFGAEVASPDESRARAERVANIKAQVEAGEYKPDMKKVAESVIKDLFM